MSAESQKESWWSEIPIANALPSDGCDGIKATAQYWLALAASSGLSSDAISTLSLADLARNTGALLVLPYDQHGKFGMKVPVLQTGLRAITALEVDGFDRLLAVGGDNGQVRLAAFTLSCLELKDLTLCVAQRLQPPSSVCLRPRE